MRVAVSVLALALFPSLTFGQEARVEQSDSGPQVVASATRTIRVAADRATLLVYIEATAEAPAEAAQRAERKVRAVTDTIQHLGLETQMASVAYGVSPATREMVVYPTSAAPGSYTARFAVRLQSVPVARVTDLAAVLVSAGALSAVASQFEAAAPDSIRRVLSSEAIQLARRDAEALAASLGGRLGSLVEATGNAFAGPQGSTNLVGLQGGVSGPTPSPDVMLTATATVRYRFLSR